MAVVFPGTDSWGLAPVTIHSGEQYVFTISQGNGWSVNGSNVANLNSKGNNNLPVPLKSFTTYGLLDNTANPIILPDANCSTAVTPKDGSTIMILSTASQPAGVKTCSGTSIVTAGTNEPETPQIKTGTVYVFQYRANGNTWFDEDPRGFQKKSSKKLKKA
jgi:hypothetical protein